jgi:hypothetical protein
LPGRWLTLKPEMKTRTEKLLKSLDSIIISNASKNHRYKH